MGPFKINKNPEYGICLNSCNCEVFNTSHTYVVIKRGCLAKFQHRECDQNQCSVLTLVTNKNEVYARKSLDYYLIGHKLFKYLNAIDDFEERIKFYLDDERCKFVLHLEKNISVVSVGFSGEQQTKALFHEVYAKGEKTFITVELLETPSSKISKSLKLVIDKHSTKHFKYSLPANLVRKPVFPEPVDLHENNHTVDRSCNKDSYNEPKNDFTRKTVVSTDVITNTRICDLCSNVREDIICLNCVNEAKIIFGLKNLNTSLSSEIPITPLEINTNVINEDHLPETSEMAVRRNISASTCIICKNHLNKSEGFELMLCKHTICEMCINNQINLEMLAHTNIMPCCDRSIEQDEIKYFLYNHEYEQFQASYKQQCFDQNCSGYHLWEKCDEERPISFTCKKCELENCLKCETIHVNLTCGQYDKIRNSVDKETIEVFLTWIRDGTAMPCPKCEALIKKEEGCDWVQCSFCNIEICWATRGPRWGPGGNGDTSGGCGCDFKVKKCVENCNYCH